MAAVVVIVPFEMVRCCFRTSAVGWLAGALQQSSLPVVLPDGAVARYGRSQGREGNKTL